MTASNGWLVTERLRCHSLTSPGESVTTVAEHMFAIQAQDFPASRWALGSRTTGSRVSDVDAAFRNGSIVRSWPLRGTLHTIAAGDLRWVLSLTAERELHRAERRHHDLGLDEHTFEDAREIAVAALSGKKGHTRKQLQAAWNTAGIDTQGQRGYHMIWRLALTGTLCWGPVNGKEQQLMLLDEWLPQSPPLLERDEALAELLVRYLRGHAPATLRDFAWWANLTLTDARMAQQVAKDRVREIIETPGAQALPRSSRDAQYLAEAGWEPAEIHEDTGVFLLPAFDEYLLGYTDRSPVCDPTTFQRIVPGGNGIFRSVVLRDGRIIGTWRATTTDPRLDVTVFTPHTSTDTRELQHRAAEWAHFQELPDPEILITTD